MCCISSKHFWKHCIHCVCGLKFLAEAPVYIMITCASIMILVWQVSSPDCDDGFIKNLMGLLRRYPCKCTSYLLAFERQLRSVADSLLCRLFRCTLVEGKAPANKETHCLGLPTSHGCSCLRPSPRVACNGQLSSSPPMLCCSRDKDMPAAWCGAEHAPRCACCHCPGTCSVWRHRKTHAASHFRKLKKCG